MLSCLAPNMLKVYENAKYQIYLLSLEDSVSQVSKDGDEEGAIAAPLSSTDQGLIKPIQDEDEDEEDQDREDGEENEESKERESVGGETVPENPSTDESDHKYHNNRHGIHDRDNDHLPASDNAVML